MRQWLLGVSIVPALSREGGQMLLKHSHGQAVADHHDYKGEEEHHGGTHQHEERLSEDTTAIHQDLLLILQADHRDGQGDDWKNKSTGNEEEEEEVKQNRTRVKDSFNSANDLDYWTSVIKPQYLIDVNYI